MERICLTYFAGEVGERKAAAKSGESDRKEEPYQTTYAAVYACLVVYMMSECMSRWRLSVSWITDARRRRERVDREKKREYTATECAPPHLGQRWKVGHKSSIARSTMPRSTSSCPRNYCCCCFNLSRSLFLFLSVLRLYV